MTNKSCWEEDGVCSTVPKNTKELWGRMWWGASKKKRKKKRVQPAAKMENLWQMEQLLAAFSNWAWMTAVLFNSSVAGNKQIYVFIRFFHRYCCVNLNFISWLPILGHQLCYVCLWVFEHQKGFPKQMEICKHPKNNIYSNTVKDAVC